MRFFSAGIFLEKEGRKEEDVASGDDNCERRGENKCAACDSSEANTLGRRIMSFQVGVVLMERASLVGSSIVGHSCDSVLEVNRG